MNKQLTFLLALLLSFTISAQKETKEIVMKGGGQAQDNMPRHNNMYDDDDLPESDEEETDPDQTDDGSTVTSQSFSFKPVDTDETEKSNIGFYVGAVAVLAASVWYFTSQ